MMSSATQPSPARRFLLWALIFAVASSCVGVPVAPSRPKPFPEEMLDFLVVGETYREDVDAYFSGAPAGFRLLTFEADTVRTYAATAETWGVFWCALSPYGPGCGYLWPRREVEHYLTLRFYEDGALAHYAVSKFGCDRKAGFCATYNGRETMALDVKGSLPVPGSAMNRDDTCTFYVYTDGPSWATSVVSVIFDDRPLGWLIQDLGYFEIATTSEAHRLEVRLNTGLSHRAESVVASASLQCSPGGEHYLFVWQRWSITTGMPVEAEIQRNSKSAGENAVDKRWRVLFRDASAAESIGD
jgi:hypothetical protein